MAKHAVIYQQKSLKSKFIDEIPEGWGMEDPDTPC